MKQHAQLAVRLALAALLTLHGVLSMLGHHGHAHVADGASGGQARGYCGVALGARHAAEHTRHGHSHDGHDHHGHRHDAESRSGSSAAGCASVEGQATRSGAPGERQHEHEHPSDCALCQLLAQVAARGDFQVEVSTVLLPVERQRVSSEVRPASPQIGPPLSRGPPTLV